MRDNQELKAAGKARFLANYWNYVIAALLVGIVRYILIGGQASEIWGEGSRLGGAFSLLWLIVAGPLEVGVVGYFLGVRRGYAPELGTVFSGFRENVGNRIGAGILVTLFSVLWSILFLIPGIVKGLSYSMTFYIMLEEPDIGAMEAIRRSQELMQGRKGKLFGLYLSFLGWVILAGLTGGILGLFYVTPWIRAAVTEFYEDAKLQQYQA